MSSIVFILGAGASRQCGAPLMSDFLDVASDLLKRNMIGESKAQFERVFSVIGSLQAVHSKAQLDLNNIESIFTALELGKVIQKVPGIAASEIPEAIDALKELIVKTLETTIKFPTENGYIGVPEPYEKFSSLVKYLRSEAEIKQTVSVISFNYDIAADMALFRDGLRPTYMLDSMYQGKNPVPLLKLHGSLNWASEKSTNRINPLQLETYLQKYSVRNNGYSIESVSIPIGTQLAGYFEKNTDTRVNAEPVIVPPSWNKADYHQALSKVWACAAEHLSEAEYIFVIGYSLPETDSFFRHLYALGSVGKSALRKFVVFNPDSSGEVDQRFRRLLGPGASARYSYMQESFASAVSTIKKMFPAERR